VPLVFVASFQRDSENADSQHKETGKRLRLEAMSRKKVILRRFTPGLLMGYLPSGGFVRADTLEVLDLGGRVVHVPLGEVKMVTFVRDFNTADGVNPERFTRKTFPARPRAEGLWVRCVLKDDEVLEGLAPLDLSLAESFSEDKGVQMAPPDVRGNVLRLYVPSSAMKSMEILAVVTTPSRKKTVALAAAAEEQADLFSDLGADSPLH